MLRRNAITPKCPVTVRTLCRIPAGLCLGNVHGEFQLGTRVSETRTFNRVIEVVLRDGIVQLCNGLQQSGRKSCDWLTHVEAARDRYEQNVEAVLLPCGDVVYRTMRDIQSGEHLFVWYGDELARHAGVPFLTPENIRGDQEYVCTRCLICFRHPNTLKSHTMWHCRQVPPSIANIGHNQNYSNVRVIRPTPHNIHVTTLSSAIQHPSHLNIGHVVHCEKVAATTDKLQHAFLQQYINHVPMPISTDVVFRPFYLRTLTSLHLRVPDRHLYTLTAFPDIINDCSSFGILRPRERDSAFVATDHRCAKQFPECKNIIDIPRTFPESCDISRTFPESYEPPEDDSRKTPSAVGRHPCIYCGKHYSRKYGLKIHLRTHTGYKPLRCRVCERPFGDPSNMNKHERLHVTDTSAPYRCQHCGKALVRRRDLERHIQSRHPDEVTVTALEPSDQI